MNISSTLFSILDQIEKHLSKDVKEYIAHEEFGIAFELICTQLVEYDVIISDEIFQKIKDLGLLMQMDKDVWNKIQVA